MKAVVGGQPFVVSAPGVSRFVQDAAQAVRVNFTSRNDSALRVVSLASRQRSPPIPMPGRSPNRNQPPSSGVYYSISIPLARANCLSPASNAATPAQGACCLATSAMPSAIMYAAGSTGPVKVCALRESCAVTHSAPALLDERLFNVPRAMIAAKISSERCAKGDQKTSLPLLAATVPVSVTTVSDRGIESGVNQNAAGAIARRVRVARKPLAICGAGLFADPLCELLGERLSAPVARPEAAPPPAGPSCSRAAAGAKPPRCGSAFSGS